MKTLLENLDDHMKEIQEIQDLYIDALCKETKLTRTKLKMMFSKNVNVYLSPDQAAVSGGQCGPNIASVCGHLATAHPAHILLDYHHPLFGLFS